MGRALGSGFDAFGAKLVCEVCDSRYWDMGEAGPRCPDCGALTNGQVGVDLDGHALWEAVDPAVGRSVEEWDAAFEEADDAVPPTVDPSMMREDLALDEVFGDDAWHLSR